MSGRCEKEKGVNVQVLLRCRPFSDEELRNNAPQVITCNDYHREVLVSQSIVGKHSDKVFTFDKVFGPTARQRDLYEQAVIPIVNEVLEGFNCTIFAYGQTGTGKTYTMEGECKRSMNVSNGELPQEAGVIPRAVKQIFDTLEGQNAEYSVKVTFLELYNEEITDLLAPEELSRIHVEDKQRKQLPLMEDGKGGVLVRGLEEEIVTSASEIFTLLERGSAKRRTAETLLNKQSSRSHSLFSITIHIKESTPEGEELIKCGKLNLVDLAGSENICRSGARDGRAREAGEINKSLLTLGRVITALVEHLGHIPYRDSKLTRLLRDSLGGRTKTCIIATVSPAVHCVEETLSTLDYAHRAKNIRNKPEVNQKMMKSTLIKDLYGEIDRLKAEVYAAREKNGVYLPKERYYQEESEKKAMGDQIEQLSLMLETQRKSFDELSAKYDCRVNECFDLTYKLDTTQKKLTETNNVLTKKEDQLKTCKYALKEREYIMCEQKKAETALANQASILRSDLEKALQDNASLFSKISRKDKLSADNRLVVDNFQVDLAKQIDSISDILGKSMSHQNDHLQRIAECCHSFVGTHDKAVFNLKKKVESSRVLFLSHIESLQNTLRLYKTSSDAALQDISCMLSSNAASIEDFLAAEASETNSLFNDLQSTLSLHQGETASFADDQRERFQLSIESTRNISDYIDGFLGKLLEESRSLGRYATEADLAQMGSISDFEKAFEEQSICYEKKLIAGVSELISSQIRHQKEMMAASCEGFRKTVSCNKAYLEDHVSSMKGMTSDAKRKWEDYSEDAEIHSKGTLDLFSVKQCRLESVSQLCMSKAENARMKWMETQRCLGEMESKQASSLMSVVRSGLDNNEQLDVEVSRARVAAEEDVGKSSEAIVRDFDSVSEAELECISGICEVVAVHGKSLENLRDEECGQTECVKQMSQHTFEQRYMDDESTGMTPQKRETVIPSEGAMESLRAMPAEMLAEEFRENNPPPPSAKEQHNYSPSLVARCPLTDIN